MQIGSIYRRKPIVRHPKAAGFLFRFAYPGAYGSQACRRGRGHAASPACRKRAAAPAEEGVHAEGGGGARGDPLAAVAEARGRADKRDDAHCRAAGARARCRPAGVAERAAGGSASSTKVREAPHPCSFPCGYARRIAMLLADAFGARLRVRDGDGESGAGATGRGEAYVRAGRKGSPYVSRYRSGERCGRNCLGSNSDSMGVRRLRPW